MEKIVGVYKITNTINGSFYIGSSLNVKHRMSVHRCKSMWKQLPSNKMYQDMESIGVHKFTFEIIEECPKEILRDREQYYIELLKPDYNNLYAKGHNLERYKQTSDAYEQTEKRKAQHRNYNQSEKCKKTKKIYQQSCVYKDRVKERCNTDKYREMKKLEQRRLCLYNGEVITIAALCRRFSRSGIVHPHHEARKYLIKDA